MSKSLVVAYLKSKADAVFGYSGSDVPKPNLGAPTPQSSPQDKPAKQAKVCWRFNKDSFQHLSNLIDIPIKDSQVPVTTLSEPSVRKPALLEQELW